ncbi:NUDIX domain-containing protein [Cytobacillus gottheilii]|uniref:NUDIX domain-containing protein n=2 Tax=Cytobacillus gottheilii TaxID=859144 RepID=A0ABX8FI02_9BACI|nr:NUDIX domain-containing protein [Cytobacillus gottheilii]
MAVAFLFSEKLEVLFLQKKQKDTFFAGFLVPIGGHIEGNEINEPLKACLREIEEETGLKREFIENLRLRYIVHRIKENQEIRLQYVFFGNVSRINTLSESDEGSLTWVGYNEISSQNVSATTIEIVNHYKEIGKTTENVYVGSMRSLKGNPTITWGLLEDWEM